MLKFLRVTSYYSIFARRERDELMQEKLKLKEVIEKMDQEAKSAHADHLELENECNTLR